jgi:hypothetical protein
MGTARLSTKASAPLAATLYCAAPVVVAVCTFCAIGAGWPVVVSALGSKPTAMIVVPATYTR